MPRSVCLSAGCPNPVTGRGRCDLHRAEDRKQSRSPNDAFYSSRPWKASRRRQLHDHPLCDRCGWLADSVHHVVPIEDGGARRDPENLVSVCRSCHSAIHREGEGR